MVGLRPHRSNSIARAFAESVLDQAESRCSAGEFQQFMIAGRAVALQFSWNDEVSALVTQAFAWGFPSTDPPSVNVYVVRLSGDGISFPDFEWAKEWIDACQPIPTAVTSPYRIFIDKNQGVIYCYDQVNNRAALVLRSLAEIDSRALITPFRLLWSWIGGSQSVSVVHAGAIDLGGNGVLLAGPSGSGKSTLSFGIAARSAGHFLADDCVVVEETRAYALYSRAKVGMEPDTAFSGLTVQRVPENLPESHRAKSFIQITGSEPWFRRDVGLTAIVFPRIAGKTGHYRLERQQAQRMLAEDSGRELFGGTPQDTIRLAKLAASLPAHRLLLGDDLDANIHALEEIVGN